MAIKMVFLIYSDALLRLNTITKRVAYVENCNFERYPVLKTIFHIRTLSYLGKARLFMFLKISIERILARKTSC